MGFNTECRKIKMEVITMSSHKWGKLNYLEACTKHQKTCWLTRATHTSTNQMWLPIACNHHISCTSWVHSVKESFYLRKGNWITCWCKQHCLDSYWQWQISKSDWNVTNNCGKKLIIIGFEFVCHWHWHSHLKIQ